MVMIRMNVCILYQSINRLSKVFVYTDERALQLAEWVCQHSKVLFEVKGQVVPNGCGMGRC